MASLLSCVQPSIDALEPEELERVLGHEMARRVDDQTRIFLQFHHESTKFVRGAAVAGLVGAGAAIASRLLRGPESARSGFALTLLAAGIHVGVRAARRHMIAAGSVAAETSTELLAARIFDNPEVLESTLVRLSLIPLQESEPSGLYRKYPVLDKLHWLAGMVAGFGHPPTHLSRAQRAANAWARAEAGPELVAERAEVHGWTGRRVRPSSIEGSLQTRDRMARVVGVAGLAQGVVAAVAVGLAIRDGKNAVSQLSGRSDSLEL